MGSKTNIFASVDDAIDIFANTVDMILVDLCVESILTPGNRKAGSRYRPPMAVIDFISLSRAGESLRRIRRASLDHDISCEELKQYDAVLANLILDCDDLFAVILADFNLVISDFRKSPSNDTLLELEETLHTIVAGHRAGLITEKEVEYFGNRAARVAKHIALTAPSCLLEYAEHRNSSFVCAHDEYLYITAYLFQEVLGGKAPSRIKAEAAVPQLTPEERQASMDRVLARINNSC